MFSKVCSEFEMKPGNAQEKVDNLIAKIMHSRIVVSADACTFVN